MPAADLAETLQRALPGVAIESWDAVDQPVVVVPAAALVDAARVLRDSPELNFSFLAEMTAADYWPKEPRFEVVYHLHCIDRKERLRLKCRVAGDNSEIESVTGVWRGAGWYEREVFDLFGIKFLGNPDLRRILMPDDWEGHPLRKDYPITGQRV